MSFNESLDQIVEENTNGLMSAHASWGRVRVSEVARILNGFPFESRRFRTGSGTPLVRIRDVLKDHSETFFEGEFDPTYLIEHGDLLIGMDGDFPCALWAGGRALLNQRVCRVTPDERLYSKRLLAAVLPGYLDGIHRRTSSITVKHLSSYTVAEIPLPLPPRKEQDRLADAIDSCLSRLDDALASLERVQRNLKRYRAAVLQAAVEGRLVPTEAELARAEGRSFEPASELLARILTERRRRWEEAELARLRAKGKEPKNEAWKTKYVEPDLERQDLPELPEGWCWASLRAISDLKGGVTKDAKKLGGREVPYLRVANVQRGHLDLSELKTIRATDEEIEELALRPGDVLFNEGGDRDKLGRGWIWQGEVTPCIHQNHVFRARIIEAAVHPKFLSWYGNSSGQRYFMEQGKQTTNLASLNMTKLGALPVPLPPAAEQVRIVEGVESLLSVSDDAEHAVAVALTRCHRLRQSILKWAFEGKLVDQDPSDEPASVLLERIRAERARAPARPARGRRVKAARGPALPGAGG